MIDKMTISTLYYQELRKVLGAAKKDNYGKRLIESILHYQEQAQQIVNREIKADIVLVLRLQKEDIERLGNLVGMEITKSPDCLCFMLA